MFLKGKMSADQYMSALSFEVMKYCQGTGREIELEYMDSMSEDSEGEDSEEGEG